jgi:hypothetical protein
VQVAEVQGSTRSERPGRTDIHTVDMHWAQWLDRTGTGTLGLILAAHEGGRREQEISHSRNSPWH